jgi:hypothetical protein
MRRRHSVRICSFFAHGLLRCARNDRSVGAASCHPRVMGRQTAWGGCLHWILFLVSFGARAIGQYTVVGRAGCGLFSRMGRQTAWERMVALGFLSFRLAFVRWTESPEEGWAGCGLCPHRERVGGKEMARMLCLISRRLSLRGERGRRIWVELSHTFLACSRARDRRGAAAAAKRPERSVAPQSPVGLFDHV